MIINDLFNNKKQSVLEGMAGKVVFSGTGADGSTYEIIQSSPTDFMIHANGRHIDTYGSLPRAISVLQNEVPGLQQGIAEGNNEQDINDPLDPNYGGNRNRSVKRNIQSRLGHDERGDARVRAGQPRSTHARHKPQLPESAMDDNAIWNRYGHYNAQDLMDEFPNLNPKDAQTIVNYAEYGWSSSNPQKFRNEVVARVKTAMGLVEGSELKQAKRKYNQAAKDANADQVGAGKKIDTMKNSLRQKDLNKPVAEASDDPFADDSFFNTKSQPEPVVRAQQKTDLAQGKGTSLKDMNPIDRDQYLKNTNRQWDPKTQRSVPATQTTNQNVQEVSLGDYRKKAMMSKAMAQTNKFFGRDDPEQVAAADRTIANRERGLKGADARHRPYTPPPVDQEKQRRDLADKYPNIDELVRKAELNRDPYYDRAEGNAYYAGRDAEHNYHRLKQIQRMIRGAELDEMDFGGVGQTTDSDTGDITTSFNQGPISVSQTKTPGGYTKQTDQRFDLGPATVAQKTVGPNIGAGQLAGTTTRTATNNMTGQSQQQVRGVGFGGASGANVGKNYVGSSDDELAQHAASVFNTDESVNHLKHLAGIKPVR